MWKAKSIFDEKNDDPVTRDSFVGSQGWCQKFMRRYALSFRPQLLRPILHNRQNGSLCSARASNSKAINFHDFDIIAIDKTAVQNDMVSNTTVEITGSKDLPMKSTGHDKVHVSVCSTGKTNGSKCKPFIVFKGAKRENKFLHKLKRNRSVDQPIKCQCYPHIETSQLIYKGNRLTGFCSRTTLAFNGLTLG